MALQHLAASRQSLSSPVLPGTWKLAAHRAITLHPREDAVLRIAHGCVWLTFDGQAAGHGEDSGDIFLAAGEQVTVQAGQRAVIEPYGAAGSKAVAYFSWDALPVAVRDPVRAASRWQVAVLQPLGDLRGALGVAAGALGRLVLGLGGVAAAFVFGLDGGRGARAFRAHSSARRAHGAMS